MFLLTYLFPFLTFLFSILDKYTFVDEQISHYSQLQRHMCTHMQYSEILIDTISTGKCDYTWWHHKLSTLWLDPGPADTRKHSMARVVIKGIRSEGKWPEFASQLCYLQAGWSWVSNWTLCLKFLSCKMRTMTVPVSQCCWENYSS